MSPLIGLALTVLAQEPAPPPAEAQAPATEAQAPAAEAQLPPPSPPAAFAEGPPSAESPAPGPRADRWQPFVMSGFIGYGTASLNTGLGLRLGYQTKKHVYVGGAFHYHFGESEDIGSPGFVTTTGVTYFIHQFELGYAGKVGPVEIRPYFAMGPAFGFTSRDGYVPPFSGATSKTHSTAAISPGMSIAIDLGDHMFLGIDGRPIFFIQSTIPQASVGAIAGARF